ncbi:MAG: SoxR reducing system RseC family protein [Alphaproteobacteria bacterium]
MLITLLGFVFAGFSELVAGLSSIIVLIPYYFWLFLNRARFRQQFNFKISKQ